MNIKDQIKVYFYDRAPNSIHAEHIYLAFSVVEPSLITQYLAELCDEGFLLSKPPPLSPRKPTSQRTSYRIADTLLANYPIVTEIEVAGIRVPRVLDNDTPRAEDINALIHAVNRIIDAKTKQLEVRMEEQNRKYWGALVTIFALFASLFSIINVGVKPALFAADLALSPMALVYQSFLNIAPLTVVLLLFVWLLHRILGK